VPRMRFLSAVVLAASLVTVAAALASPAAGGCSGNCAACDKPHPFSVHDMLAMRRIADPQVSPDGKQVAFVLRDTDLAANKGVTDLWLAPTQGGEPRQLTNSPAGESNPRWADDGRLYFLSTRSGSNQIWVIDPRGGEATQVSQTPVDVGGFFLAPQLGGFLLTLDVYPGLSPEETVQRDAELAANPRTGRAYDELMFRHWDSWEDGKRNHLFVLAASGNNATLRDLMLGLDVDAPTKPFGGLEEVVVSPDGAEVIFAAKILPGSEAASSTDCDLYAISTTLPGEPRCLTEANQGYDNGPAYSPDGQTLAWLAMERPGYEADRQHVVLLDVTSGKQRRLSLDYDGLSLSPGSLTWDAKGKTLYCTAAYHGQTSLFAIDVQKGTSRLVVGDGTNNSVTWAGDRLLYLKNTLRSPNEIFTVKADGKDAKQITDLNGALLARARMGEPEQFTFQGWNDETVHAYVVKPYDFTPEAAAAGRKWPLAFLVHGGPQGSFGNDFHYRWNPQAYVGAGFATVAIDFHGSTGYGQEFTDAINGHWGDRPLEDLEKGLAAALAQYPWLDDTKVVAAGASYGGYMINWMHGQPFGKKFRAFVTHDGNLDERMAYFDTEELWFPEWEHGGTPWTNPEGYASHNPIDGVQNWSVPTLVVHGGLDYRVVDTQGLSTFTALRRQGVPARLLHFPDENHWVLKPANSIQWHEEVMGWLNKWTE
jgi:dipeptidyl aminopeptidase/acylaminoacyl peptidase